MQRRLEQFGGSGEPIVFAHANGYPVGSYRKFIAELTTHFQVTGFHQRPLWSPEPPPVRLNWKRFAEDLIETLDAQTAGPVWMMGHSLGGAISTLAAARRPDLFKGLLLIDPVFLLRRHLAAQALSTNASMDKRPMIAKTLTRPNRFVSQQAAFDFYRPKRVFQKFADDVLWDYVMAGTRADGTGEFELAYAREWEAAAYRSGPWVWPSVSKIRLPVLGLRGETSDTLNKQAFERWGKAQPQADLRECSGGHLLPLEYPQETAAHIIDFLATQRH